MKITAVSFSDGRDSMGYRGLLLMDKFLNFNNIVKSDLPLFHTKNPFPSSVDKFITNLEGDVFVFSVPEATGHYATRFKNAIDWLVFKDNMNASLGQDYSISNKPVYIITFTPVITGAGNRHFPMTKYILEEKLGAKVIDMFVKNNCYEKLIPSNLSFVKKECDIIKNTKYTPVLQDKPNMKEHVTTWIEMKKKWNSAWT